MPTTRVKNAVCSKGTFLLFLMLATSLAYAEMVRLDCEHDGGIRRLDGGPSDMEFNFFQLDFDMEANQILFPNGPEDLKAKQVNIRDHLISFLIDIEASEYRVVSRRYWISRNTGKLYVHQFGFDKDNEQIDIIATGVCKKRAPIF